MESILKEMYDRNLGLENGSEEYNRRTIQLLDKIDRLEMQIAHMLNSDGQNIFNTYLECFNELCMLQRHNEYTAGVRLGGQMILEILFGSIEE